MPVKVPEVDDQNPFYCPSVTAVKYLEALRNDLRANPGRYTAYQGSLHWQASFAKRLEQSLDEGDLVDLLYRLSPHRENLDLLSVVSSTLQSSEGWDANTPLPGPEPIPKEPCGPVVKRKRSHSTESFSDLLGPPKYERSFQSVNDDSFYLSGKAERIRFFDGPAGRGIDSSVEVKRMLAAKGESSGLRRKIRKLEDELFGQHIGTETPRGIASLVTRLDKMLPGIRLKQRLYALGKEGRYEQTTHQGIADVLGADGHLNARVLNILRTSEVDLLDLSASIMDQAGLNLGAADLLRVFAKPNSFLFLTELSLRDAHLQDTDLLHIHHLPRIATLWLSNTGIGNEGVFHLVALKRTLTVLDLALNPRVDDDAMPALLLLHHLRQVSLFDTSVSIAGVRRLLLSRVGPAPPLDIDLPRQCEIYLDKMHKRYSMEKELHQLRQDAERLSLAELREHLAKLLEVAGKSESAELVSQFKNALKTIDEDESLWQMIYGNAHEPESDSDEEA